MSESATRRIPVEIWQRILGFSVFVGPICPCPGDGFIENILVFQDDCPISAAYQAAESTSRRLKLVCRSWNTFLSSLAREFVAIPRYPHDPNVWPSEERIRDAKRINVVGAFRCICTKPCRFSRRWNAKTSYKKRNSSSQGGFRRAIDRHGMLSVEVLQGRIYDRDLDWEGLPSSLPNLRALSTDLSNHPLFQLQEAFPRLTHLDLTHFNPTFFPNEFNFPTLTTLLISITQCLTRAVLENWYPLRTWDLPMLSYLHIEGDFNKSFVRSHLATLLQSTGASLRGMAIKQTIMPIISPNGFSFPDTIWECCPRLSWIGGSAQSLQRMTSPPHSVSIKSIWILALFGRDKTPNGVAGSQVRETSHLVAACSRWNVNDFRIGTTWEIWLLRFFDKPLVHRAEWVNFMIQFGLFGKRHGPALCDIDGVAFDEERAVLVRQAVQFEVVILSEMLEITSWTKVAFKG